MWNIFISDNSVRFHTCVHIGSFIWNRPLGGYSVVLIVVDRISWLLVINLKWQLPFKVSERWSCSVEDFCLWNLWKSPKWRTELHILKNLKNINTEVRMNSDFILFFVVQVMIYFMTFKIAVIFLAAWSYNIIVLVHFHLEFSWMTLFM